MKILLIGDPHFKASNLAFMKKASEEILQLIVERKPDLCIVLGDTLDTHERINMFAHVHAISWFISISEQVPLVILIGNHDRENNQVFQTSVHPFVGLIGKKNITVVDKAIWDKKANLMYVPYVPPGRFREALETGGWNMDGKESPRFIFAHQEFSGSKMGVKISTKGDDWSSSSLPHVFSGHIHEYQELPGITYVGTFHQQNYGESDDKALLMLTYDENCTDEGSWFTERIRLNSIQLRTTIDLSFQDISKDNFSIPPDIQDKKKVKIRLHLENTEVESLKTHPRFQELKRLVDKVEFKIKNVTRVDKMNLPTVAVEEIVKKMLMDDPFTFNLFISEVAC